MLSEEIPLDQAVDDGAQVVIELPEVNISNLVSISLSLSLSSLSSN
jgi:hypothetical protein